MPTDADMHAGFLAAIIAEPAEDVHRLVYADWLEDHGEDNRAEFIRSQIAVASTGQVDCVNKIGYRTRPWDSTSEHLIRCGACAFCRPHREAELLSKECAEVATGVDIDIIGSAYGYTHEHYTHDDEQTTFHSPTLYLWRGFVHAIRCTLEYWLAHGPEIVRAQPVEVVRLTDKQPHRLITGNVVWRENNDGPESCHIGPLLWHLDNYDWSAAYGGMALYPYVSAEEAHDDLSRACLAWARSQKPRGG